MLAGSLAKALATISPIVIRSTPGQTRIALPKTVCVCVCVCQLCGLDSYLAQVLICLIQVLFAIVAIRENLRVHIQCICRFACFSCDGRIHGTWYMVCVCVCACVCVCVCVCARTTQQTSRQFGFRDFLVLAEMLLCNQRHHSVKKGSIMR